MKVSLNVIKKFTDINIEVDELVSKINAQLGGVDEVIDLEARYKDALIVKVAECDKHSNADKLSVCRVDDGGVVKDIPRDEHNLIQVVCGAPNVKKGMWAVWLPPHSTVPASFTDREPFVLAARELRGVLSQGMLASSEELGLASDSIGILEITNSDVQTDKVIQAGASFAKLFDLDDIVIDIENKMFTHRPDLFGQLGVAREIAGILHQPFRSPAEYLTPSEFDSVSEELEIETFNDVPDLAPRFLTLVVKDIEVKSSPLWLQIELIRLGMKPISNVVDVTNFVMLHTAQPTHAYDYDKLNGKRLGVRMARDGEEIMLLNKKCYKLTAEDVVIADAVGPVGLAGIMGGLDSEVSSVTKNIVLEVANFDMYSVRRSSMRHGVFTDALTRFNKGQSPLQNNTVMSKLLSLIQSIIGGAQAGGLKDQSAALETLAGIKVDSHFINQRLGLKLTDDDIKQLLKNVELQVDDNLIVTPPFWRTDLRLPEDIVEEVGRLHGFDKLQNELPRRQISPAPKNKKRQLEQWIRSSLSGMGANEILSYSFVSEKTLVSAGQNPEDSYKISNAISPELQCYRLSVTPSILEKIHENIKAGYPEIALYEIGKAHTKTANLVDGVPPEQLRVGFIYAAQKVQKGAPYYYAKRYLDQLMNELGIHVRYVPLPETNLAIAQPFYPSRRARVIEVNTGYTVAIVGEFDDSVSRNFKLPDYAAGFELLTEGIQKSINPSSQYRPLSRYPSTSRDLTIRIDEGISLQQIVETMAQVSINETQVTIKPTGIYQPVGETEKNVTFNIGIISRLGTLTSEDASAVIERLVNSITDKFKAEII